MYLPSVTKSAAAQCNFLRGAFASVLWIYICIYGCCMLTSSLLDVSPVPAGSLAEARKGVRGGMDALVIGTVPSGVTSV